MTTQTHEPETYAAASARSDQLDALIDERAAQDPTRFRMLTGDRPTGPLHIGHYLASLRNRVRLQEKGVESFVVIADYQVITDRDSVGEIGANVHGLVLDYLAAGLDPERTTIFTHSAVPALNQLMLPFLSLVTDAELRRNPTVKDELALSGGRPLSGLLLTYPVHQAADILFCKANLVPVGLDQLPHIEATRLIARRFNERYDRLFPEPDALLSTTPLLLGVDGQKMSKTRGNGIALRASEDETAAIVRRAPTDSERRISYEPDRRPRVANLLDLLAAMTGEDPRLAAERIGDGGAARLKRELTEALNEVLRPVRERRRDVAAHPEQLDRILDDGNARAREIAAGTLAQVHAALGMSYADAVPAG
jgi:tryptophanyl-tRNA synthetase